MKLGIFGSRSIRDDRVFAAIDEYLGLRPAFDTIVTAQEPIGVCTVAQIYAKQRHFVLELHHLNMDKFAQGAHEHRSLAVTMASDAMLFIHDGESVGTANEIGMAQKLNKAYHIITMPPTCDAFIPRTQRPPAQGKRRMSWAEKMRRFRPGLEG